MSVESLKQSIAELLAQLDELTEKDKASLLKDEILELRKVIKTDMRTVKQKLAAAEEKLDSYLQQS